MAGFFAEGFLLQPAEQPTAAEMASLGGKTLKLGAAFRQTHKLSCTYFAKFLFREINLVKKQRLQMPFRIFADAEIM